MYFFFSPRKIFKITNIIPSILQFTRLLFIFGIKYHEFRLFKNFQIELLHILIEEIRNNPLTGSLSGAPRVCSRISGRNRFRAHFCRRQHEGSSVETRSLSEITT